MSAQSSAARVVVYVDGFNFYHSTRGTDAYQSGWCDWRATAQNYCGRGQSITGVRYFTSQIVPKDPAKLRRQDLHIRAMETVADVVYGEFARRNHDCPKCGYTEFRRREKMTDVNIAVQIVVDAVLDLYDEAFVVTADLDLLPAIRGVVDPRLFAALQPGKAPKRRCATA